MPFVTEGHRTLENRAEAMRRVVSMPSHPLHYTAKEIAHAALDDVGLTWNAVNFLARGRSYEDDPTYVLSQDKAIKPWFEMYPEEFKRSVSAQNSMDIVARIERGKEASRILSDSGGAGIMASLAAGVLDPVNLIPLSWLTKAAQGTRILEAARVSLRIKYGALASDDAVRLGVSLTPDEMALVRGIPDTTSEVEALRRMGVRTAKEQRVAASTALKEVRAETVPNVAREVVALNKIGDKTAQRAIDAEVRHLALEEAAGKALLSEAKASADDLMKSLDSAIAGGIKGDVAAGKAIIAEAEASAKATMASVNAALKEAREAAKDLPSGAAKALLDEAEAAAKIEIKAATDALKGQASYVKGLEGDLKKRLKQLRGPTATVEDLEEIRVLLQHRVRNPLFTPRQALGISEVARVSLAKNVLSQADEIVKGWKDDVAKQLEEGRSVVQEGIDDAQLRVWEAEDIVAEWKYELDFRVLEAEDLTADGIRQATTRLDEAKTAIASWRTEQQAALVAGEQYVSQAVSEARDRVARAKAVLQRRQERVALETENWDYRLAKLSKAGRVEAARKALEDARGAVSARKLRLAEAAAEGEARMHAVRTSQLAVAAKIKDHKKVVDAARKRAMEGLPSPLEGAAATVAEGAVLGAGFSGASEVFLQAVQDGREDELLENSFLAGGILGAVLGGAGAFLRAIGVKRLIDHHEALVEELTSAPAIQRLVDEELLTPEEVRAFMVGGKGKDGVPRGTMEERAGGVVDAVIDRVGESSPSTARILKNEKSFVRRAMKAAVLSPVGRMFYSISPHAQALSNLLVGVPYLQKGQKALGPSASRRMEIWNQTGTALAYKLREIRGRADPVAFGDEVAAYVMSGGKTNASPEAIKAAEEWIAYSGKTKETIKSAGVIDDPDLGVDVNYFPHVWIHDELRARKNEFIDRAAPYYNNDRNFVRARLEEHLSHPLSLDPDSMNFHAVTGSLLERGWKKLPGHEFLDFMHTDLDYIVPNHARKVGAQVEVARLQPNGTMAERLALTEWRAKMDEDYQGALDAATTDKQKARILKEWEQSKIDLDYTLESLLGFLKRDPFDASTRAISDAMTTGATLMYGGNFGWNSLGDPMGAAFVNGARPWLKVAVARLRRTLAGIPKDELAKEAYLYQFLGGEHSRHALQFDMHANSANAPSGHGGIWRRVHNGFMLANGLRFITAKAAEMNTYLAIDTLLGISRKVKNGVALNKAERQNLLLSGLDEATASRIGEKVLAGGATENHGILLAKLSAWGDDELSDTFRAAVAQNVHRGVMNPARAEMPMAMKGHLGRVLFQFLQFQKAANDNFLISGLQRADGAAVGGALMMLGMGVFIETVNYAARGKEIPELDTLLADGFNRAGLVGYLPQVNEWAAGMTGGVADINHLFGTKTVTERYGTPDAGSMIPGFSAIDDIGRQLRTTVRLINGEEITEQQAKAFARRIPYMNAVHMTPVREIIQEAIR